MFFIMSIYWVTIIRVIHVFLMVSLAIAPLVPSNRYKTFALTFLLYLVIQYITGYQRCGLTILEYMFLGETYKSGFLYRLINPLITINECYFDYGMHIVHAIYIFILLWQTNTSS